MCLLSTGSWAVGDEDHRARSLAHYTLGVVSDLKGDTEDAIRQFEKSAEYYENYAAHLRLGADYARLGNLQQAITELNLVLEYDVNNIQARYLLALIYSTKKEYDKAANEYESILTSFQEAEPENIEIYGYLAQLYYSQKQYDKAIEQFKIILSLDSDNTDVMFLLGSLYLDVGERDKAVETFTRAIAINPDQDGCLNSLGYLYAEEGVKLDEARTMIEHALEIDPDNPAYLDSLGWVYYKKGEYETALQYLNRADSAMKDPVIYEHIGDVYYKIDQKDKAEKYWKLSLDLLPDQQGVLEKLKSIQN